MLAEVMILVPYWRTLPAEQFFSWYQDNANLLVDFYSPLEIASAVLSLLAAILAVVSRRSAGLWVLASIMSLVVIALFFVYFKDANAGFCEPNRGSTRTACCPRDMGGVAVDTDRVWHGRVCCGNAGRDANIMRLARSTVYGAIDRFAGHAIVVTPRRGASEWGSPVVTSSLRAALRPSSALPAPHSPGSGSITVPSQMMDGIVA
jgi:hypothetical protein